MTPADFRRIALSLEGAEEGSHFGAADFRVGGRIFATLAAQAQGYGNLMLTPEQQAAFVAEAPEVFLPVPGGWGRNGATHLKLAAANEYMKRDLEVAARVQQAFLPTVPPEFPGARFAWTFRPCSHLVGDFFNVFRLDDRHLGLCVLDVSGHGIAAALLSVTASHLLARVASPLTGSGSSATRVGAVLIPPSEVTGHLSKHFSRTAGVEQPFTLLYGILGLDTGEFRFVSAGHPGPVHLPRDGPPAQLEITGVPIGVGACNYAEQVVNLRAGDRLVLYTDGVTETRNPDGEHFGSRRFLATLKQTLQSPLDKGLDTLVESIEGWRGDTPRHDDISILLVERTDPAGAEGAAAAGPTPLH